MAKTCIRITSTSDIGVAAAALYEGLPWLRCFNMIIMSARTVLAAFLMAVLTAFLVWAIVDPAGVKRFGSGSYGVTARAVR